MRPKPKWKSKMSRKTNPPNVLIAPLPGMRGQRFMDAILNSLRAGVDVTLDPWAERYPWLRDGTPF